MRIKGLLRAADQVRMQLRLGVKPGDLESFAAFVNTLIRQVEEICARHGLTPEHLPSPSQRAYQFLKQLDLEKMPVRQADHPEGHPTARVAMRNVCLVESNLADRLWHQLPPLRSSADLRKQLQADIERHVAVIEGICTQHNASPGTLEMVSRRVYCWLKFLADGENLTAHLAALERAEAALKDPPPTTNVPFTVHLLNMGALWRKRRYSNVVLLKVNEGFLNAEPEVWRTLVRGMLWGRDSVSLGRVREFAESEDFSEVLSELESLAEPPGDSAQGCVHDLEASFTRVNATYFGGGMAKPRLMWNRALTGRKLGHYRRSTDTVMLSVTLDAPDTPAWVVDFVMYHELLHKKHGIALVNGRHFAHTPAFRADERVFAEYEKAERVLNDLAKNQLSSKLSRDLQGSHHSLRP